MFRLTMNPRYAGAERIVKNLAGTIVVFRHGVADVESEAIAKFAASQHYIQSVEDITPEATFSVVEAPATGEPDVDDAIDVHEDDEVSRLVDDGLPDDDDTTESPTIETAEASADQQLTGKEEIPSAEEITALHEELGTWTAVAERLDVSVTTLRKYREEAGLI